MFPERANCSKIFSAFLVLIILSCAFLPQDSQTASMQATIEAMSTQLVELGDGQAQPATPPPDITLGEDNSTILPDGSVPPVNSGEQGTLELIGQYGGSTFAVAVQGDYAFLGQGPRLITLDISQPNRPRVVGQSEVLRGVVQGIALNGKYAYVVAAYDGLSVFDISQPDSPDLAATLDLETPGCNSITIEGNQAYLACNPSGFHVIDISDPLKPVHIGQAAEKGAMLSIANRENFAYVVDSTQQGLAILDHSNLASPKQVGLFTPSQIPSDHNSSYLFESVRNCGEYLCIADGQNGLVVLDITQPDKPVALSVFDTSTASGLIADGNTVFVADDLEGIHVIDITNPKKPRQVGMVPTSVGGEEFMVQQITERGMAFSEGYVFTTDEVFGLEIVDARNPSSPERLVRYNTPVPWTLMDISIQGQVAYTVSNVGGFRVVDISDPANMNELFFDDERKDLNSQTPSGLVVVDNYAYISDSNYPFHIYDISNPSKPVQTGAVFDHAAPDGASDIAVAGNAAYVSGHGSNDAFYPGEGLWVIDIADRQNPKPVKFLDLPNGGWQLSISGNTLYALDGPFDPADLTEPISLRLLDISNPFNPQPVKTIPFPERQPLGGGAMDVLADGNRLFVSLPPQQLKVFDISVPDSPVELGAYQVYFPGSGKMAIDKNNLVTGTPQLFDVSVLSAQPSLIATATMENMVFEPWSFDIVGDLVYVATNRHGIYIYRIMPE